VQSLKTGLDLGDLGFAHVSSAGICTIVVMFRICSDRVHIIPVTSVLLREVGLDCVQRASIVRGVDLTDPVCATCAGCGQGIVTEDSQFGQHPMRDPFIDLLTTRTQFVTIANRMSAVPARLLAVPNNVRRVTMR